MSNMRAESRRPNLAETEQRERRMTLIGIILFLFFVILPGAFNLYNLASMMIPLVGGFIATILGLGAALLIGGLIACVVIIHDTFNRTERTPIGFWILGGLGCIANLAASVYFLFPSLPSLSPSPLPSILPMHASSTSLLAGAAGTSSTASTISPLLMIGIGVAVLAVVAVAVLFIRHNWHSKEANQSTQEESGVQLSSSTAPTDNNVHLGPQQSPVQDRQEISPVKKEEGKTSTSPAFYSPDSTVPASSPGPAPVFLDPSPSSPSPVSGGND